MTQEKRKHDTETRIARSIYKHTVLIRNLSLERFLNYTSDIYTNMINHNKNNIIFTIQYKFLRSPISKFIIFTPLTHKVVNLYLIKTDHLLN